MTLRRAIFSTATTTSITILTFFPRTILAEVDKKPIYDDSLTLQSPQPQPQPQPQSSHPIRPTPTDRLESHIRDARLFVNSHYDTLQAHLHDYLSQYFQYEATISNTLASIAPSKESGEKIIPGAIYIAVAAMSGSILTRRRIWPIRALTPIVVGIGASWYFLPETTRNVANLIWRFEQKVPAIAETHIQIRDAAEKNLHLLKSKTEETKRYVDETVSTGRETIESWVKKG